MAIKDKDKSKEKKFNAGHILREYKYENLLLGTLALVAGAFSIMLIQGEYFQISSSFPVIGKAPMVFAWTLFAISVISLLLVLAPFSKPAWSEIKKVTWPTMKTWGINICRVLFFMVLFVGVLLIYDAVLRPIMGAIYG